VPGPNDDLEARVSALEAQMRLVRADAAAARVLAGGADRDVSAFAVKLDAHTRALNALRETQLEQSMAIGDLSRRVDTLDQRLEGLDQRLECLEREMRNGFAMTAIRMARITELLEGVVGSQPARPLTVAKDANP
jgi:chromosome segregation ATPase